MSIGKVISERIREAIIKHLDGIINKTSSYLSTTVIVLTLCWFYNYMSFQILRCLQKYALYILLCLFCFDSCQSSKGIYLLLFNYHKYTCLLSVKVSIQLFIITGRFTLWKTQMPLNIFQDIQMEFSWEWWLIHTSSCYIYIYISI